MATWEPPWREEAALAAVRRRAKLFLGGLEGGCFFEVLGGVLNLFARRGSIHYVFALFDVCLG